MYPRGMDIWKWLARRRIGLPSLPMFGLLGQTKVGLSGKGGVTTPNPKPRPPAGKTVVGVPPLLPEPMRVVEPTGGIPGGPRGEVSRPGRCPGGPPIDPEEEFV